MVACAFEFFMIDRGDAIEYNDVSGSAVSFIEYDLVHENAMAPDET